MIATRLIIIEEGLKCQSKNTNINRKLIYYVIIKLLLTIKLYLCYYVD